MAADNLDTADEVGDPISKMMGWRIFGHPKAEGGQSRVDALPGSWASNLAAEGA